MHMAQDDTHTGGGPGPKKPKKPAKKKKK
ncbi:hypothetical protein SBA4_770008 [Candidatus Sulfopaludibacter sp. SbA4]|nr:hypothetical protein SBA4_770008 [Candidatus Sulfopaludibacter sp. SbA4]